MAMNLITGAVAMVLFAVFCGILIWWIKALPLIIIFVLGVFFAVYDLINTVRRGENGAGR
jgi:hypothetical protein